MQNAIGRFVIVLALAVGAMPPVAGFAQAPSPESRPATLPPETMQAFQQAYPDATITTTLRDRLDGRTVFIVDSVDKDRRRVVTFDERSAVVSIAEQVEEADLPPPVAAAMHADARLNFVAGVKFTRGSTIEYRLTVRGARKTAMVVKPDGTVVSFK
jgi:hypothetical protein